MIDLAKLYLQAGSGGNGKVSFFRNRRVLKGGPDGGNGGRGGHIILQVDNNLNTLQHFAGKKEFIATDGMVGGKARKNGVDGTDVILCVPAGTLVWLLAENKTSQQRRQRHGLAKLQSSDEVERERFYLEKETASPPPPIGDDVKRNINGKFIHYLHRLDDSPQAEFAPLLADKLLLIANLSKPGKQLVICQGGFGGRGNDAFKNSRHTTPLEAEYGTAGERKIVFLELRLLANLGLVGLPNAGKSSLLRRLTRSLARVADYPFTTMVPNLGVWQINAEQQLVVADIPGLIEGASQGRGLGFTFLRHIQNTSILLFVLSLNQGQLWSGVSSAQKSEWLWQQYCQLEHEVTSYNRALARQKRLIVINKADLYSRQLQAVMINRFAQEHVSPVIISTATGEGLEQLAQRVSQIVNKKASA